MLVELKINILYVGYDSNIKTEVNVVKIVIRKKFVYVTNLLSNCNQLQANIMYVRKKDKKIQNT